MSENHKRRKSLPLPELPTLTGYAVYQFTKVEPASNCYRFYQLVYQPSLWSKHCVYRSWGRIGKKLRTLEQEFDNQEEALQYIKRSLARRLRKGYALK